VLRARAPLRLVQSLLLNEAEPLERLLDVFAPRPGFESGPRHALNLSTRKRDLAILAPHSSPPSQPQEGIHTSTGFSPISFPNLSPLPPFVKSARPAAKAVSYTYTSTPWGPAPALNAPLEPAIYWDGKTYAVAYTGTGYTSPVAAVSYGHIYYALNSTFVPAMYVYTGPTGAYVYRLTADVEAVPVWATTYSPNNIDYYTYARYSYAGYLRLALGGNTTSYDAMYGWGIVLVATQQVNVNTGQAPGAPEGVCTPVKTATPEGEVHTDLQYFNGGYKVTVDKAYQVTKVGCGYNETYTEYVQVASYTVNGQNYYVTDPYGRTCVYGQTELKNGVVYCNPNKSS